MVMKSKDLLKNKQKTPSCFFKLKQLHQETINCLVAIIEALDPYTRHHSFNVANYALLLGEEMKLPATQVQLVHYAGLFHDIGKIGISPDILRKQGSLTPREYALIKEHPAKGAHIMEQLSDFKDIVPIILHHHEQLDGNGYPFGLKGEAIPFGARIIAVVDAYDAITTNRSYRKAQRMIKALDVIKKATPQQFDPIVVEALVRVAKNL